MLHTAFELRYRSILFVDVFLSLLSTPFGLGRHVKRVVSLKPPQTYSAVMCQDYPFVIDL